METHEKMGADGDFSQAVSRLERDPRIELSLVAGMALLKLAGIYEGPGVRYGSRMESVEVPRFLQSVAILDSQLHKTPDDIPLRLLLVQLYLLLGCATLAYRLWAPMDVKRAILDALSPLFFDRISSISPGLFHLGSGGPSMEPLKSYYDSSLQDSSPVKIWDAFSAGSYSSIVDMAEFNDRLRRSCTRVMAIVEDRRAARAFGAKVEDADDVAVFCERERCTFVGRRG